MADTSLDRPTFRVDAPLYSLPENHPFVVLVCEFHFWETFLSILYLWTNLHLMMAGDCATRVLSSCLRSADLVTPTHDNYIVCLVSFVG